MGFDILIPQKARECSVKKNSVMRPALEELSRRLGERGVQGEICVSGGAAMILAFRARQTTKHIDSIFAPPRLVREIVEEIGQERGY